MFVHVLPDSLFSLPRDDESDDVTFTNYAISQHASFETYALCLTCFPLQAQCTVFSREPRPIHIRHHQIRCTHVDVITLRIFRRPLNTSDCCPICRPTQYRAISRYKNRSRYQFLCRGELRLVILSPTVGHDLEAVTNRRPITGAPVVTFPQSSNRDWCDSRCRSQCVNKPLT